MTPSPVLRAATILRMKGYAVLEIREPGFNEDGVILFVDPHTLKRGWNGRRPFGVMFVNDSERTAMQDSREIEQRVREAEADLMAGL